MKIKTRKKNIPEKTVRIIFCILAYTLLALFIAGLFMFNANYTKIYKSPAVKNGKADFSCTDLPSRDVSCNLAGEWEFFYNKWIITDNCSNEPDGMLKLPGLWTYRNYGNGALPKTGYASYRLKVENIQPDVNIIVYRHNCNFAYRVFINGQLNVRSGNLSKNISETKITGSTNERHPYLTDGSPLEIVIELSASNSGGLNAAPWLASTSSGISYGSQLRAFTYVALGITSAALAISILTYLFFRYKRDITVPALMVTLYVHFLSSKDMLYVIPLPFSAAMIIQFFSALAAITILMVHLWRSGVKLKMIPLAVISASASVLALLALIFYGTPLAPVFAFMLFALGCAYLVPILFNKKLASIQTAIYGALFLFLASVFCFELCDGLGLLVFGTEFIFTCELMIIIACFTALWLWKMAKSARVAIRVSELECELSSVKQQALKAQIKPHFVYNSLTAIQSRYRNGLKEGDKAIEQFARHLRLITDSDSEETISFEDEVRNVLNYFELENLRADGKLNLLLDLDYTDFSVPVLSLQPLVENAIRHGGLSVKKDGYVQLSSSRSDGKIIVSIIDNGNGFDVNSTHTGVGIENTRKRFELFGAKLNITSEPDCGTHVTIEIPLE